MQRTPARFLCTDSSFSVLFPEEGKRRVDLCPFLQSQIGELGTQAVPFPWRGKPLLSRPVLPTPAWFPVPGPEATIYLFHYESRGLRFWQIINQPWEPRGQMPGLLIFNIRRIQSGEYFMMGLSHFNTSWVTPTPTRFLVNYSHPDFKDLSPFPPFSSSRATVSSPACTHLKHTLLLEDLNLLLERRVTESIPVGEQPHWCSLYQVSREEER